MDVTGIIQVHFEKGGKKVIWGRISEIWSLSKKRSCCRKRGRLRRWET